MPHDQLSFPERSLVSVPSASETFAAFALLRNPVVLQRTESWPEQVRTKELLLPSDEGLAIPWDERQQRLYERDLQEDAQSLMLRVLRVHFGLVGFLNQGRLRGNDPSVKARTEAIFEAKLKIFSKTNAGTRYDEATVREFLRQVNTLVPAAYAFQYHPELQEEDLERMYNIVYRLEYAEPLSSHARERVRAALDEAVELERRIENMLRQGELFSRDDGVDVLYEHLTRAWGVYRMLFKVLTNLIEEGTWISPARGVERHAQLGYGQSPERGLTDYQRFGSKELHALERRQGRMFAQGREHRNSDHSTIFFPSGMAAAQAIMLSIREDGEDRRPSSKVIAYRPMYFEVDDLLRQTFSHAPDTALENIAQKSPEELATWIVNERPRAVFLAPVTNDRLLQAFDLKKFFTRLHKEVQNSQSVWNSYPVTTIVVDNTLAGRLQTWQKYVGGLPRSFEVLSYESLVKYAQDGQEFTNAGMITGFGNYAHTTIESMRNRRGMMPSPTTIHRLNEVLAPEMIKATMRRQSRNARIFAAQLRLDVATLPHSLLRTIRLPETREGEVLPMGDVGGICTLEFDFSFLRSYRERVSFQSEPEPLFTQANQRWGSSRDEGRQYPMWMMNRFVQLAVTLARAAGVDLVDGASFGFRGTRVSVYESLVPADYSRLSPWQANPKDKEVILPYIRVSLGAEPLKQMELLSMVMARANRIFSHAIEEHRLGELMQMLEPRARLEAEFLAE